jgi:predicted Zn-dependent protease
MTAIAGAAVSCQHQKAAVDIDKNTADTISVTSRVMEEITPEQEYYIGRAVAANILARYKIWDENPALTAYLNKICAAITVNSLRPGVFNGYHVAILDSNEINAFATSGGHIFVTRGLVNTAKSEDALASIIAHEIAHIQLQHGIKAIRTSRIIQALTAASLNVNELTNIFNESVGEIVSALVTNGYPQTQEFEADSAAMSLLASAGYNPLGLIDMLTELSAAQTSSSGLGKTHPNPAQRMTSAQKSIGNHNVTDTRPYRQSRFASVR